MPTTPFVPNNAVVEVELRCLWEGQRVENTLYFECQESFAPFDQQELADALATWYEENITPLQCNTISLNEIVVTSLASETAPSVVSTTGLPLIGTNGGDSMPNGTSFVIKFNSAGRGRSSRGRNYVMAIPRGDVTGNLIVVGLANSYVDAYNALKPVVAGLDPIWDWVVYSRRFENAWRESGVTSLVSTASYTDLVVDAQRRRLPGRGT